MRPRLLRADNFTPATRTPWGGRHILDHYKRGLDLARPQAGDDPAVMAVCGESWEISVEPSFPSRLADDDTLLAVAIAAEPERWLGPAAVARGLEQTPLLVKIVDAREQLSVQVHPAIDDPLLAEHESGKLEVLFVLRTSSDDAGVYLGFRDGVSRDHVEQCLRSGGRLDQLMNFVPVRCGDALTIEAGTVHAIGAGVTLLEPQYVSPGRSGVTYRFWDWNRRYDGHGVQSEDGQPRPLHIDRALAVTDWDGPRGQELLDRCRSRSSPPRPPSTAASPCRQSIATSSRFAVERWSGAGALVIPAMDTLLGVVCIAGAGELSTAGGAVAIRRGQSAVVPAAAGDLTVVGHPENGSRGGPAALEPGIDLLVAHSAV